MIIFSLDKWTRRWSQARFGATSRVLIGRLTLESKNLKQICVFRIIDCYLRLIVLRISAVDVPKFERIDWTIRECGQTWFINLRFFAKVFVFSNGFRESGLRTFNSCSSELSIEMKNSKTRCLNIHELRESDTSTISLQPRGVAG